MKTPTMLITPRRAALLAGHENELDVLVRVQAPPAPVELSKRKPLHLAIVIDRSGSMSGRPLEEAKRCAEFVLGGLDHADRLTIVTYDDKVHTLYPPLYAVAKQTITDAIRGITLGGTTNLHGGWFQGAENLSPHVGDDAISRVILLSDGCANSGLTDPDAIYAQCAEFSRAGISTSTYGLGDGFNEELMIGMARHGGGNAYYGRTADDLLDPFREEFDLLNALYARRLRLEVEPAPGVRVKLLNDYVEDGNLAWQLPNLAFGGEAWAVLRLRVPASDAGDAAKALASISLRYTGLDGEPRAIQPRELALAALPTAAFSAVAEDELVVRRVDELDVAELQRRARESARRGDWNGVERALRSAEKIGKRNPWVAVAVGELRLLASQKNEAVFAKEAAFGARRMSSRLAACDEVRSPEAAPAGPSYLRRKTAQGKRDPGTPAGR
jgi:Ca-activated chloride channel family protein